MKELQIWSYGDSLAQPRKGIVRENERYLSLLRKWMINQYPEYDVRFFEHQRGNSTIPYLNKWFKNDCSYFDWSEKPFCLIVHAGICDCAPRPIPARIRGLIGKLPESLKRIAIGLLNRNRAKLQNIHIFRTVSPKLFSDELLSMLDLGSQNFEHVIMINIAPTTLEIENHSPGLSASIELYNELISDTVSSLNASNITLVDINTRICLAAQQASSCMEDIILKEDGHHLTAKGHSLYYESLKNIIVGF